MQETDSDTMYGIAKKFNREMEALPIHTHSAIVEMIRVGMQHRNLALQKADQDRGKEMQERSLAIQEQQTELARAEYERRQAENLRVGPELVTQ